MSKSPVDRKRFTDRPVGVAVTILGAAIALHDVVQLLESIAGIVMCGA